MKSDKTSRTMGPSMDTQAWVSACFLFSEGAFNTFKVKLSVFFLFVCFFICFIFTFTPGAHSSYVLHWPCLHLYFYLSFFVFMEEALKLFKSSYSLLAAQVQPKKYLNSSISATFIFWILVQNTQDSELCFYIRYACFIGVSVICTQVWKSPLVVTAELLYLWGEK